MSAVEGLFRLKHLPKIRVCFDLGFYDYAWQTSVNLKVTRFGFDRLAPNSTMAIFKIDDCHKKFIPVIFERIRSCAGMPHPRRPKHMLEFRRHVNDTKLPGFTVDEQNKEISFDWLKAFSLFFAEEKVKNTYIELHVSPRH